MTKGDIYTLLKENCKKNDYVLIDEEVILAYKDINDETLELEGFSDDDDTNYYSFIIVIENDDDLFIDEDGKLYRTEPFYLLKEKKVVAHRVVEHMEDDGEFDDLD